MGGRGHGSAVGWPLKPAVSAVVATHLCGIVPVKSFLPRSSSSREFARDTWAFASISMPKFSCSLFAPRFRSFAFRVMRLSVAVVVVVKGEGGVVVVIVDEGRRAAAASRVAFHGYHCIKGPRSPLRRLLETAIAFKGESSQPVTDPRQSSRCPVNATFWEATRAAVG